MPITHWISVIGLGLAIICLIGVLRANRCPACKKWFGLRAKTRVIDSTTQEHYETHGHRLCPTHEHVGTTVTNYLQIDLSCMSCSYQNQYLLAERQHSRTDAFGLIWFLLRPAAIISVPLGILGAISFILAAGGWSLPAYFGALNGWGSAIIIGIIYFSIALRDCVMRQKMWQIIVCASLLMWVGLFFPKNPNAITPAPASPSGVSPGQTATGDRSPGKSENPNAKNPSSEKTVLNSGNSTVSPKAVPQKDGCVNLRTPVAVMAGVEAWVEVDGKRHTEWPVGIKQITICLPPGSYDIQVLSIYNKVKRRIYANRINIQSGATTDYQIQ